MLLYYHNLLQLLFGKIFFPVQYHSISVCYNIISNVLLSHLLAVSLLYFGVKSLIDKL